MTVVVMGLDALDPELVSPADHPNLVLDHHRSIETIESAAGEPSTHELWPTIITGLRPEEHGLELGSGGVGWQNPALRLASTVADYVVPDALQSKVGAWLLNNTEMDAFRTPASYYPNHGISTLFDDVTAKPIGIPNYVVDPDEEDREHALRQRLGEFMDFDPGADHTHTTDDVEQFYEFCMEMAMIRIARARRALRGQRHELVFAYTSGLDLIGHVTYDRPNVQRAAYDELDEFVAELRSDLRDGDELLLVSDHGLQNGLHTDEAMVAATSERLVDGVESVLDVRESVEGALQGGDHRSTGHDFDESIGSGTESEQVREQLEDLGYI